MSTLWTVSLFAFLFLLFSYYVYFKFFISRYWKKKNVPHEKPIFILGNLWKASIFDPIGIEVGKFYRKYKKKKIVGLWLFSTPLLVFTDMEIIKNVLVRDFVNFHDHCFIEDCDKEPLARNLFNVKGARWRNMRVKLTPTFTSGKMKMMFASMIECGKQFQDFLKSEVDKEKEMEVKDMLARFTTDVISSCAFGIESNSFKNPNSELRKYGKKIFEQSLSNFGKFLILNFSPRLFDILELRLFPKDVTEFFLKAVRSMMEYREKNEIQRNDFIQLLIQLKNKGKLEDADGKDLKYEGEDMKFGYDEAAAQAFMFFMAGSDTSSSALEFALYELALNKEIQGKLQEEIDSKYRRCKDETSYETITEMEYLDWVVRETLRKYPPVTLIIRKCTKDYEIPEINAKIDEGTSTVIPVYAIHRDPDFYPNPEKFDPTRFSPVEKAKRPHFSTLYFGEGPRICIGSRFGILQVKVGLISILLDYNVDVTEKTPIPMTYDPRSPFLSSKGDLYLKFSARQ